ncbi:MAG: hypothetical protein ABSB90_03170 [Thermoplasmata archaeon]|jgi:hypothetical protein
MILDLLGRALEASAKTLPGPAGDDRAVVGAELRRLDRPAPQPRTTSR